MSYYSEFRQPAKWENGNKGFACICYKGCAEYSFKGGSSVTKALANCSVGETVDFPDIIWFQERTVFLTRLHNGWTFASQYPGKEKASPDMIFNAFQDKNFRTCLQQANTYEFWAHELTITTDNKLSLGKSVVCVSPKTYTQIKEFYEIFQKLGPEPEKDGGFLIYTRTDTDPTHGTWVFDKNWNIRSVWFRSDAHFSDDSIIEDVNYVRPTNVIFN